jgi:Flp pilus assembly protein TadD
MKRTFLKLAASALMVGSVGMATAGEVTPKMMKAAAKAADQAMAAIKEHQQLAAVRYAERAVLYNPESADHRALLGQAYLQAGRFPSAETAFSDALRLAPEHGRAALGLSLVKIAVGKPGEAVDVLDQARGRVPDADVGLALALAGDRDQGLAVLEPAARAADASAKTRQNLALVYALSGRWAEARATAAVDVSPAELDKRMIEWADFTRPRGSNNQVASLLGVKPVLDSGMPTELALLEVRPAPAPMALAAVEPQPAPVTLAPIAPAPTPVAEVAAIVAPEPAPVSLIRPVDVPKAEIAAVVAPAPAPVSLIRPIDVPKAEIAATVAPSAPAIVKPAKPYLVAAAVEKPIYVKPVAPKPVVIAAKPVIKVAAHSAPKVGNFVVQLGAFSSQDRLERGWNNSVSKLSWLKGYEPVSTTFKSPANGRSLHRLAISGFSSRIEAVNLCRKMREAGSTCFVRGTAGDAPVRWVKRETVRKEQYASR